MATLEQEGILSRLESSRRDLLDMGLRNPLIHFHHSRARSVPIVPTDVAAIFQRLVTEAKALSFETLGDGPAGESSLVAPLTDARLRHNLTTIHYTARTLIEEQGVNTLFLALGVLTWFEADQGHQARQAPLILIPVTLERGSPREHFRMRFTGEELEANLSLQAKLAAEFGIALPDLVGPEDLDPQAYFAQVRAVIEGQPRWQVVEDFAALAFFSFGKFLMYKDLDATCWPEDAKPTEHLILQALLGDGFGNEPDPTVEDPSDADLDPAAYPTVVDADSSQLQAVAQVAQGQNLVIQGPPGTGKSQTITNMIADALGRGKTVLFVSEKMAALEVVKRRLDAIGLGDACLELHSHKANKKAILAELRRTLELGRPRQGDSQDELRPLAELRDRLNAYSSAMNTPIGPSKVSPQRALGMCLKLARETEGIRLPRLELEGLASWEAARFQDNLAVVVELQGHLQRMGPVAQHPFRGCRRQALLPTEILRLREAIEAAEHAMAELAGSARILALALEVPSPETRTECEALLQAARCATEAPDLTGCDVTTVLWAQQEAELSRLLVAGARLAEIKRHREAQLLPEAWQQDLLEIRSELAVHGDKWWRFLLKDYQQARKRLVGFCHQAPQTRSEQLTLVDELLEARRLQAQVQAGLPLLQALFGSRWQDEASDWEALRALGSGLGALHREVQAGRMPQAVLAFLAGCPAPGRSLPCDALERALEAQARTFEAACRLLELDPQEHFGAPHPLALPLPTLLDKIQSWSSDLATLSALVTYNQLAAALTERGLTGLLGVVNDWPSAGTHLVTAFQKAWYEALLDQAFHERPALVRFDGGTHSHARDQFQTLDMKLAACNRAALAQRHWEKLPSLQGRDGQLGVLRWEFEKKMRHLPIRQLVFKAGNALQAIKPVFMMSPLSIASFLPPGALGFDLVIFDEASQVAPVDAFGAIQRGRQVVVVGDHQQMPPTDFFATFYRPDDEEDEETRSTSDIESILGLFLSQGAHQRMLRWHYRSRHESLIAVSNHEFYEDRLLIFPSPHATREDVGLVLRHLPLAYYDRGGSRNNPAEALAVAEAVMQHARTQPHLTLGVAAFSLSQMEEIQLQVERLRRQASDCEPFFRAHPHEPFFVKNLESLQGDERDVILISIGYGKTAQGYLAMSFGPLNRDGGERRLNVLITRARRRCEVFSNLKAEDLDLGRSGARGVQALKSFLQYAETGQMDVLQPSDREMDSPFEEEVARALVARGHQVRPQVGSAGFFIDLGVLDPEHPGRYLLGIECDGATYHCSRSARDRDRLRQQVLEGLGWRIHRIWSTDWFRSPEQELERVLEAIVQAREARPVEVAPDLTEAAEPIARELVVPEPDLLSAYRQAELALDLGNGDLHLVPEVRLAGWIQQVVAIESPVHRSEVFRRISAAAGKRMGVRIQSALEGACALACRQEAIAPRGEFLWNPAMDQAVLRDRSHLPAASRKLEWIAPEELELAIVRVIAQSYGITAEQLAPSVLRLLGLGRTSEGANGQLLPILQGLLDRQQVAFKNELLVCPEA